MDATDERQLQFFRSLFDESDRGSVLLVASSLDETLQHLHRVQMKSVSSPSREFLDRLFATHAPLSTFAARIQLGYGYGLVEREDFLDLELLRKLRNDAAHSPAEFSFESSETRTRVFALKAPKRIHSSFPQLPLTRVELAAVESPTDDAKTAKMYLALSALSLNMVLLTRITAVLKGIREEP